MAKTSMATLRAEINQRRRKKEKWREIGASFPGVPLGTLCRIAHDKNYEPKSPALRAHLGLAPLPVQVSPCQKCGQLHAFSRRCPGAATKYAKHPVMRLSRLRAILTSPYRDS